MVGSCNLVSECLRKMEMSLVGPDVDKLVRDEMREGTVETEICADTKRHISHTGIQFKRHQSPDTKTNNQLN
jgi:hypothetical protein